jgi:hypothetical protein
LKAEITTFFDLSLSHASIKNISKVHAFDVTIQRDWVSGWYDGQTKFETFVSSFMTYIKQGGFTEDESAKKVRLALSRCTGGEADAETLKILAHSFTGSYSKAVNMNSLVFDATIHTVRWAYQYRRLNTKVLGKELCYLITDGFLNASIFMNENYDLKAPFISVTTHKLFDFYFTRKNHAYACDDC